MPAFPHAAPAPDLTTAVLLAQDDIGTRLTVLALNSRDQAERTQSVLTLLEELLDLIGDCEEATSLTYGRS
jgi:hypothetical protein